MGNETANPESAIARIAARQHGVVTTAQLERMGVSRPTVTKRVRSGRLHRVHRGVYAVGHRGLGNEGRWMAAVLAGGEGAVLSHRSAAELWKLLDPKPGLVDITLATSAGRRKRHGLRIHRSSSLTRSAVTARDRIPVTNPARTLADLKRCVPAWEFRRAVRQAEFRGLTTGVLGDGTRSEAEAAFLRLCRRHRIPVPEVNQQIGRFTVDFLWRRQRLVVEIDGFAAHRGRQAFEDDRVRELELAALGFRLRRFSARQVAKHAAGVARGMRAELGVAPLFP